MATNFNLTMPQAERLAAALRNLPIDTWCRQISLDTAKATVALAAKQPPVMGATPGTSGKWSTGNYMTIGKSFYRRGVGSFSMSKRGKIKTRKITLGKAGEKNSEGKTYLVDQTYRVQRTQFGKKQRSISQELDKKWSYGSSSNQGKTWHVRNRVKYASIVHGDGKGNKQSDVMAARNWKSAEEIAEAIEKKIAAIVRISAMELLRKELASAGFGIS